MTLPQKIGFAFASNMADDSIMRTADFPPSLPVIPTKADLEFARRSKHQLEAIVNNYPDIALRVHSRGEKQVTTIPIPTAVLKLLVKILTEMAAGNAIAILPLHREMTTQEAADFLEMSRPSLVKLLDQQKMRFRMVGKHRRILLQDLLEYKKREFLESCAALDELAKQAQELGLGY